MRIINAVYSSNEHKIKTFINAYNEFYPQLKYFSWSLLADKETAEAVTIYAFIRLGTSKEFFKDKQHIRNYLYRITRDACYDELYNKQPQQNWFKRLVRDRNTEDQHASLVREEAITFDELGKALQMFGAL